MEKILRSTLTRALGWGAVCVKLGLVAVLFVPGFFTVIFVISGISGAPRPAERGPVQVPAPKQVKRTTPKVLAKIYSIVKAHRPEITDHEARKVSTAIFDESARRDVDPMLVLAVIKVESGFRYGAVSPMGARGIMQIMPETGKFLSEELLRADGKKMRTFTPDHLDDPLLNIKLGVYYLDGLKKQFRNLNLALLAYNLGPGEVQNRLANNVRFSDEYAAVVLNTYREYKKAETAAF